ncbi:porwaprin-b [Alligator mississippiensis]|uniref:Porwaprin-b-like n=1 Tax=Alligator mississippiensis TaxID=8496 RepID=A0A151MAL1_ALLMI|nr:porwaprin-b [Alligator mississippiensis]KYO21566.1 porwaprin-b-like [Alligator mississippiensis]
MKSGSLLLLAGLLVLCAQLQPASGMASQGKPGLCPRIPPGTMGICVEECSNDMDCSGVMKCCFNGCGHVCMNPVSRS